MYIVQRIGRVLVSIIALGMASAVRKVVMIRDVAP